jgi:hypothetical protein
MGRLLGRGPAPRTGRQTDWLHRGPAPPRRPAAAPDGDDALPHEFEGVAAAAAASLSQARAAVLLGAFGGGRAEVAAAVEARMLAAAAWAASVSVPLQVGPQKPSHSQPLLGVCSRTSCLPSRQWCTGLTDRQTPVSVVHRPDRALCRLLRAVHRRRWWRLAWPWPSG